MAMTTPVEIRAADEGTPSMAFVLPEESSAKTPTPLADSDVRLELVPERLVAVVAFPGLVTDEEVERQRAKLQAALPEDVTVLNADEYSVLQYNAPYTIPFRRRNEVAVVVAVDGAASAVSEGGADEAAEDGGSAPSDVEEEVDGAWAEPGPEPEGEVGEESAPSDVE